MPKSSSQPANRYAFPRTLLAGFVTAALATLVIAFVNVRSADTRMQAVKAVDRTTETLRQLSLFNSALKDAEIGQRGYLLTGDVTYLQPYLRSLRLIDQRLALVKEATSNDSAQRRIVSDIEGITRQKLAELHETVEMRKAGNVEGAMAVVRTDSGKEAMDRLRDLVGDLYSRQMDELAEGKDAWAAAAATSTYYSWGGSLLLLVLILASAGMTVREYRAKARQSWVTAGLSGLSLRLQGDHRLDEIGKRALDYLAEYLGADVGAGYVVERSTGELELFGGFALPPERLARKLQSAEGLAGQAVTSRRLLHVRNVPAGHLEVASATGRSDPAELVLAPAIQNGRVYAVLELGFNHPVSESERNLLEGASEMLASAIRSGQDRSRLEALLEETQRQAEELQTQQEELRVSNEELEQQSRILQESQARMELQQTELEQTNANLESQADQLLRVQDALTEKARQLSQASQFKSEFLANMSHELRTPLNSTLILAKLLSDNKPGNLSAEQVKYAQTIYSAGSDLLTLINDILDLSKIEAGQATVEVEQVAVAPMLQRLLEPLRPMALDKGLALELDIDPAVPASLHTDAQRLGQVLKNLLSNALKFTQRGTVALRVSRVARDRVAFAVQDTGIGVPADQQELIFEAFRQADGSTHRKFGGTGLGLSISRDLATLLGGSLSVTSTPGQGSVFTLEVPVRLEETPSVPGAQSGAAPATPFMLPKTAPVVPRRDAPAAPAPKAAAPSGPEPERSILVIEDDERFAGILSDLAREMGFGCFVAHTATDGLELATRERPNAIVLDINLPDFSGLGVLDQLKRNPQTRHIPVHVVSVADYAREAMGRGAAGYALKPVKREELVHALQRLEAKFTRHVRHVLVVEDDDRQRESVRQLLARNDVEIAPAATAAAALALLRETTFDCVVMDLNLPDMSGYELLQQMTEQEGVSFPPVIVYTGRALSRDEEQHLRRFSKSIIIKDARSPERLLDEVTLFLHQVEAELPPEQRQMLELARSRDSALEGRTVLVVEDDVRNVFALSSILEPTGVRVEIARNGREALDVLGRAGADGQPVIDLVLMDIMMPEMDGYTAMREIRKRPEWRRLPIIALTAKAMKDDQEKCLAAGANDYIAKPLDVERLLSLVRVWMRS
ncbi:histidine kinase [Achromobacter marplatensis]|uniref:histidine kinase n=1 Tax=Achromobacter marplatensis TaxID=470868 RepID=A0ABX9GHP0_9BURK|nr:response regulator [Achromobacter marplatensis]OWT54153.1 histidine kinase [Achromobacter marplatensis]RBP24074.1 signal transduction histidine kinase [Achromobacter marplatensis]CAB3628556.1 Sensor histidine kinase RcsC [Achromobacter marplatensis]